MQDTEVLEVVLEAQDRATRTINQAAARMETRVKKLEQSFRNVITVAAKVTGAIYGIQKAWDAVNRGAAIAQQRVAFENIARSYHVSAQRLLRDLQEVADGTVATADMIHAAGEAMMMGIRPEALSRLMGIARATARLTGQEVTQAFNDITLGVARQSKMILDNLGIIVRVKEANEKYAAAIGKVASELTDAEKKQAFLNATLRAGEDLIKRLGDQTGNTADNFARFKSAVKDLNSEFSSLAANIVGWAFENPWLLHLWTAPNEAIDKFLEGARKPQSKYKGVFGGGRPSGHGAGGSFAAPLPPLVLDQHEHDQALRKSQASVFEVLEEINQKWREKHKDMAAAAKAAYEADLEALKYAKESGAEIQAQAADQMTAITEQAMQRSLQLLQEAMAAEAQYIEKGPEAFKSLYSGLDLFVQKSTKAFDYMERWSQRTAEAMEQSFSNLFFDIMQGKFKGLGQLALGVLSTIQRAIADYLGQQLLESLTKKKSSGGGLMEAIFGGFTSALLGSVGGGAAAAAAPTGGYYAMGDTSWADFYHSGGVVGATKVSTRPVPAMTFVGAPRLHTGLGPDEFPAILQRGETVLPKGAYPAGDTHVHVEGMTIIANDAKSFVEMMKENKGAIVDAVGENLMIGGGLRHIIRRACL